MRIFTVSAILSWILVASAYAAQVEFSADTRVTAAGRTAQSKFFFAGDRWRMEENLPQGKRVTIFSKDSKALYVLWPDSKRYVTQPLSEKELGLLSSGRPGEEMERTELGREQIAGYPTVKSRVKYQVRGREMAVTEWFSQRLGVILRAEAEDGTTTTALSGIEEKDLDRGLFEVPAEYRLLSARDLVKKSQP